MEEMSAVDGYAPTMDGWLAFAAAARKAGDPLDEGIVADAVARFGVDEGEVHALRLELLTSSIDTAEDLASNAAVQDQVASGEGGGTYLGKPVVKGAGPQALKAKNVPTEADRRSKIEAQLLERCRLLETSVNEGIDQALGALESDARNITSRIMETVIYNARQACRGRPEDPIDVIDVAPDLPREFPGLREAINAVFGGRKWSAMMGSKQTRQQFNDPAIIDGIAQRWADGEVQTLLTEAVREQPNVRANGVDDVIRLRLAGQRLVAEIRPGAVDELMKIPPPAARTTA